MFGLKEPTVQKMIQDLPGAENCRLYIRKTFLSCRKLRKVKPRKLDIDVSKFVINVEKIQMLGIFQTTFFVVSNINDNRTLQTKVWSYEVHANSKARTPLTMNNFFLSETKQTTLGQLFLTSYVFYLIQFVVGF